MRVVFRVDGSTAIGAGHVSRCIALAESLRNRGVESVFATRGGQGNSARWITSHGFQAWLVPPVDGVPSEQYDSQASRRIAAAADAAFTANLVQSTKASWTVVDHYELASEWERDVGGRVMVIDDLPLRDHACHTLVVPGFKPSSEVSTKVATRTLAGPDFALLRPEFGEFRRTLNRDRGALRRILVAFGGSDPLDATRTTVEALQTLQLRHVAVDVIVGAAYPHLSRLMSVVAGQSNISVRVAPDGIASLMSEADLSVGACGTMALERLCLQLPTVAIAIADNQVFGGEELARLGLIRYLGRLEDLSSGDLVTHLSAAVSDFGKVKGPTGETAWIDGLGAERLAEYMFASRRSEVVVTPSAKPPTSAPGLQIEGPGGVDRQPPGIVPEQEADIYSYALMRGALKIGVASFKRSGSWTSVDVSVDGPYEERGWESWLLWRSLRMHGTVLGGAVLGIHQSPRLRIASVGSTGSAQPSVAVVSDEESWINPYIASMVRHWLEGGLEVSWSSRIEDAPSASICFLLGSSRIAPKEERERFGRTLVVHESDVPKGRGWSPMTWQVVNGRDRIAVTLLEAVDDVDSGPIFRQQELVLEGTELVDDLRSRQADATMRLCTDFISGWPESCSQARDQVGEPSWYRRRTPQDSALDPNESIASQMNLLRVVDNAQYPAFFEYKGCRYVLHIHMVGQ